MQNVAREMNLSETAFLVGSDDGYQLRWFTPLVEVDLCGHATLASAHVLWETGEARPEETIRFHTKSGLLLATRDGDWIELDFPATPVSPCDPPSGGCTSLVGVSKDNRPSTSSGRTDAGKMPALQMGLPTKLIQSPSVRHSEPSGCFAMLGWSQAVEVSLTVRSSVDHNLIGIVVEMHICPLLGRT